MGMVVRSNIMALNANRQLGMNNSQVSKSLEKLSSGFKINRAGDDASGLAISEKMKAQIKGLETASANSQDGISLVQTAEGALTEVHSMLNRMVELATKSANGTMQDEVDREAIQSEVDALNAEIDRIGDSTNFNGINLLDGSLNTTNAVTTTSAAGAALTVTAGTAAVDRTHVDAVNYHAEFAAYDITNSHATDDTTSTVTYNTTSSTGTVDLTVAASGGSLTVSDMVTQLNANGGFSALYTASSTDDNRLVITAKANVGNEAALGIVSFGALTGGTSTVDKGTDTANFGEVITSIAGVKEGDEQATLGSTTVTMLSGDKIMSGSKLTIGSQTFEFLKDGATASAGNTGINITDATTADEIAKLVSDAATGGVTGFDLTYSTDTITVKNTVVDGQNSDATDPTKSLLTGERDVRTAVSYKPTTTSTVTFDAAKLSNNTTVKVGDKTYKLTYDSNAVAENGETLVKYNKGDTSAQIASAFATAAGGTASGAAVTVNGQTSAASAGLSLQIGDSSDTFNKMSVSVADMRSAGLGVAGLDVSTADAASNAIKTIKDAINKVSTNRANMGALQNRLEYTINNLDVSAENLTSANSRIRDTDMAKEMMNYTKMNVLTQAAQAMLAQANQQPQSILQLLQ